MWTWRGIESASWPLRTRPLTISFLVVVVWVDQQILKERGGEAAAVHGISDKETALGLGFVHA